MVRVQVLTGDAARAPHLPGGAQFAPAAPSATVDVQPLGVFAYPAGLMVITGDEFASLRATLAAGCRPASWPPELAGIGAAYDGRLDEATELLTARARMTDHPLDWCNLATIAPERVNLDALLARIDPRWHSHAQLVLAHLGRGEVPDPDPAAPPEVRALILAAQAGYAEAPERRRELLDAAIIEAFDAPALRALCLAARAEALRELGRAPEAITDLREALRLLADADLPTARAELHLALGQVLHEHAVDTGTAMNDAAAEFQSCLQIVDPDDAPLVWAAAHRDLAAVYLTMPLTSASDQLRVAVATQSLRKALAVYTRDEHPEQWAATSVNLANALVYAPSAHQEQNLMEAVQLYADVLAERDPARDPAGYARVLANQGNALAHLGMFPEATAALHEARFLFEDLGADEMVRSVRGVLDEIARARTRNAPDPGDLDVGDLDSGEADDGQP